MVMLYVDTDGGNYGVAGSNLVTITLGEIEEEFFADLNDSERVGIVKIMQEDDTFTMWSAHTALMERWYGIDRCSTGCMCNPMDKHESDACEPDECPFDHGSPWVITESDGSILDRFDNEGDRDEALLTGEYPEDAEPAFVNDPKIN